MKTFLINQFNLTDIENFNEEKCTDTLAFLRYILKRSESETEKQEINSYIERITDRCKQLQTLKAA
jgi:hypothetical protein